MNIDAVLQTARSTAAPPTELTVSEFCDRELIVTSGPLSGTRWQTDFAPYQRGILNAIHEPGCEHVVVLGSSQWGKTACTVGIVAYHIAHNPCGILIVQPTVKPMAEDFAKNRLDPVIRASPVLNERVDRKRAKDASNTTLLKTFRGGYLALAGSNSAASLAARPVQLLVLDEVDRYERELKGEGDTISVAIKRTTTFRSRRRVIMVSSPTLVGSTIHTWFEKGDQRRYYVPCPGCGVFHPYEWKNVRWDPETNDPRTARLVCPACGYQIDEAERVALLSLGEWRSEAAATDPSVISFHMWEAYSPLSTLSAIVRGFLDARAAQKAGDRSKMHTWQNTTLGEPIEPDVGVGLESHTLLIRREGVDLWPADVQAPLGVGCITMGVDTQDDRLEVLAIGWGVKEESWVLSRHTIPGDTSRPEPWEALAEVLSWEFRHETGQMLRVRAMAVDSAGHRTSMVYHFVARWQARNVYAIIGGREGSARPIVSSPSPRRFGHGERTVPLYTFGVDAAKSLLMGRLQVTEPGPGYVHLPMQPWCDEEFAEQLTSERLKESFERGVKVQKWKKLRPRNEAWDCFVYALGAFHQLQPDTTRREFEVAKAIEDLKAGGPKPPSTPTPQARPGWIQSRPNWLRGGR
jgi:phage terminase large subunit GpA-like protein